MPEWIDAAKLTWFAFGGLVGAFIVLAALAVLFELASRRRVPSPPWPGMVEPPRPWPRRKERPRG